MTDKSNLTEAECFDLIKYTSDSLSAQDIESAVTSIVERLRVSFGVSCVRICEVFSRSYSLRYTYTSQSDSIDVSYNNVTISFDKDVWQNELDNFAEGYYIYNMNDDNSIPRFSKTVTNLPKCMMQIPMYADNNFIGILDLLDFEKILDFSEREITTLRICANLICQYLYRLNSLFNIDPLTGFMNFNFFTKQLDEKISQMPENFPIVVVYSDIHHFKYINDTYGYKKGDELLKLMSQTIYDMNSVHEGMPLNAAITICRAYADNFITYASIPESLVPMFESLIIKQNETLGKFLQENCPDVRIRINTGIYYIKEKNITAATAIANANLARKTAKKENRQQPLVFSQKMMDEIKKQEYLNNELPKAIKNHNLKVYYQPKINCTDDSICGAEALIRWQKPDGTFIYPDSFIPVFESNGTITDVDFYVYREVFQYIRKRLDTGLPVFPISMNVSRVHFRSNRIITYVEELLEEFRIPPQLVEFELTENIYMDNLSRANEFINICHDRGIKISMDDFGSGYSSLNVISSLSIDTLKIDRIFLKNGDLSKNDKAVIESVIAMARRLGMKVICEGVETEAQAIFLKNVRCDQIQGYYYGKPMDEESFNIYAKKRMAPSS